LGEGGGERFSLIWGRGFVSVRIVSCPLIPAKRAPLQGRQGAAGLWFKGKSRGIKRRIKVFGGGKWLCTKVGTVSRNPVFMVL